MMSRFKYLCCSCHVSGMTMQKRRILIVAVCHSGGSIQWCEKEKIISWECTCFGNANANFPRAVQSECMQLGILLPGVLYRRLSSNHCNPLGVRARRHSLRPRYHSATRDCSFPVESFLGSDSDMLVTMLSYAKKLLSVLGIVRPLRRMHSCTGPCH